jgi:hypothetical protein
LDGSGVGVGAVITGGVDTVCCCRYARYAPPPEGPRDEVEEEIVGASGVTLLDALDAEDVPAVFVAVTVKVYDVPLVRPVTT